MEEEVKKISLPKSTKVLIGVLIGLIVVLAVLAAYFGFYAKKNNSQSELGSNVSTTVTSQVSKTVTDKIIDSGVTWIKAVKLDDLGLFKKIETEDMGQVDTISYYKVGTMSDGSDIIDAVIKFSPPSYDIYRIVKKSGVYYKVAQNSVKSADANNTYSVSNLLNDASTSFASLVPDPTITTGQTKLTFSFNGGIDKGKDYSDGTKIVSTKWGDIYKETGAAVDGSNGSVEVARYYILLNDSSRAYYEPNPTFLRDDGTLDMNWTNADKKNLSYQKVATSGCGGGGGTFPEIAKTGVLDGKSQVASDTKMFFLDNKSNEVDQFVYGLYKNSADPKSIRSIDEFITNIGLLVWTDDYGSNILFSNRDFAFEGECGKPVVYLYPEKPTQVSVKVGANITASEPDYGSGWDVTAKPNGELSSAGKIFPYLFWEGKGIGIYPQITSGTVVKTQDVIKTIQGQLGYIGLNQKEISDFVEFWGPKIPQTKYVRLTWLQNQQMDELAPLKISPKPQSVIRVFLDFAGQDTASGIPVQQLKTYPRNGFTAVEWGGLLRK